MMMSQTDRALSLRGTSTRRSVLLGTAGFAAAGATNVIGRRSAGAAQGQSTELRIGYEGTNTQIVPFIESAVAAVEEAHPGVSFTLEPSPGGNYIVQLGLQLFSGRAPDLFLVLGLGAGELANGEFVLGLDDYVAEWEGWEHYFDAAKQGVSHDGTVWGVPYSLESSFLYYRRDLFERAGLPRDWQPSTPDDILEAAAILKEEMPEAMPYALYAGANGELGTAADFMTLLTAYGGTLTDEQGRWFIDSCLIQATLRYYNEVYQVDQSVPQSVMTDVSPIETMPRALGEGSLGMLYEQSWRYQQWHEQNPEETEEEIGFALFPRADGESHFALSAVADCWFINRRCENPDLAWAFIEAFNSREQQVEVNRDKLRIPARMDAAGDPAFQETPFQRVMIDVAPLLVVPPPEPTYRQLVRIVQNATGLVATGEADPVGALARYSEELVRVLGTENVVAEACP
jgi:multiple sugar transport system substrate-binding protein